eukprot:GEMP01064256.1.p1 GENE.GEMP01064256.1~~GEMP01064256.1.p1  ORF type:complete len:313 (+),score=61.21 GEMP01064256.1:89-1027(+)
MQQQMKETRNFIAECCASRHRQGPMYDEHEVCLILKRPKRGSNCSALADPEAIRNLYVWEPEEGKPSMALPKVITCRSARKDAQRASIRSSIVKRVSCSTVSTSVTERRSMASRSGYSRDRRHPSVHFTAQYTDVSANAPSSPPGSAIPSSHMSQPPAMNPLQCSSPQQLNVDPYIHRPHHPHHPHHAPATEWQAPFHDSSLPSPLHVVHQQAGGPPHVDYHQAHPSMPRSSMPRSFAPAPQSIQPPHSAQFQYDAAPLNDRAMSPQPPFIAPPQSQQRFHDDTAGHHSAAPFYFRNMHPQNNYFGVQQPSK